MAIQGIRVVYGGLDGVEVFVGVGIMDGARRWRSIIQPAILFGERVVVLVAAAGDGIGVVHDAVRARLVLVGAAHSIGGGPVVPVVAAIWVGEVPGVVSI